MRRLKIVSSAAAWCNFRYQEVCRHTPTLSQMRPSSAPQPTWVQLGSTLEAVLSSAASIHALELAPACTNCIYTANTLCKGQNCLLGALNLAHFPHTNASACRYMVVLVPQARPTVGEPAPLKDHRCIMASMNVMKHRTLVISLADAADRGCCCAGELGSSRMMTERGVRLPRGVRIARGVLLSRGVPPTDLQMQVCRRRLDVCNPSGNSMHAHLARCTFGSIQSRFTTIPTRGSPGPPQGAGGPGRQLSQAAQVPRRRYEAACIVLRPHGQNLPPRA